MRRSFYRRNGLFEIGEAPMPVAAPDQALLRVRRVGICGSDLHIFQGHLDHRVPIDGTIGHEVLADVVSAPAGSRYSEGDRVVVNPVLSCGSCKACRMGADYLCYSLKVLGVDAHGGMQDYWAVGVDRLLPVPDAMPDNVAALIEPMAVATHDVKRAGVKAGDTVLVFGGGPIGCLIALVARQKGAHVRVSEINPWRVRLLQQLGFETIGPGEDPVANVRDWTSGNGVDIVFEVSGSPDAVRLVTDVVRVWGTVSIIAIHSDPVIVNLYPMFARELNMHGSRLYTHAAWVEAIDLMASGTIDALPLVSRLIPLEDLQQGMEQALGGGPVMKILVDLTA